MYFKKFPILTITLALQLTILMYSEFAIAIEPEVPATGSKAISFNNLYQSSPLNKPGRENRSIDSPAVDKDGHVYTANILGTGSIAIANASGDFVEWFKLPDKGQASSVRINAANEMFVSDYKNHRIYRINIENKQFEKYFENKALNQPNDMAITRDGTIYFTDPTWSKKTQGSIYRITPDKELQLIMTHVKFANGIDLSPNEERLYFTESVSGSLFSFELNELKRQNFNPESPKLELLKKFESDTVDGLRTDVNGNIYVTRIQKGTVDKLDPQGQLIRSISLNGHFPTNLCFGGKDGNVLFVTTRDKNLVEMILVEHAGREWSLLH